MWRPSNWDNIIRDECYDGHVVYREIDTFGVGADAALKAVLTELEKSYVVSREGVWMWDPTIVRELIEALKKE